MGRSKVHYTLVSSVRRAVVIVSGVAPFYLILSRLLSSGFGTNGVLFFLAVLGMPVSLWFAGLLVRIYVVMVRLPRQLEKERGKPALVVS